MCFIFRESSCKQITERAICGKDQFYSILFVFLVLISQKVEWRLTDFLTILHKTFSIVLFVDITKKYHVESMPRAGRESLTTESDENQAEEKE